MGPVNTDSPSNQFNSCLLIALIGLQWGGLVVDHPVTFVQLGALSAPIALLTLFGLLLNSILMVRRVPGAILIGVLGTAVAGYIASRVFALDTTLVEFQGVFGAPPSPSETALAFDFRREAPDGHSGSTTWQVGSSATVEAGAPRAAEPKGGWKGKVPRGMAVG